MRGKYDNFRIREIDGGLNIRDSANEIANKQGVICENFNFEGNRLVSSKGMLEKYNNELDGPIKGMLVDGNDLYYVHGGKVYKNGIKLTTSDIPDRRYNMDIWNSILILTSIDKDGTANDRPIKIEDGVPTYFTDQHIDTPTLCKVYNGKLILAGYTGVKNTLLHSKTASATTPSDLFVFGAYNGGSILLGDGSPITGLEISENGLYAFKHSEVWYSNDVNDTGTSFDLIFRKITANGPINQSVIARVSQDIIYYDNINKAVRRLSYEANLTTLRDSAISDEIRPIIEALPDSQEYATASYKYPNYKLFLRSNNSGINVNDICLVYNVDRKSWSIETDKITAIAEYGFLGSPYFSKIYEDDITFSIDGLSKGGIYRSKEYDLGDGVDLKRYSEMEIKAKLQSNVILYLDVLVDGEIVDTREYNFTGDKGPTLGTQVLGIDSFGGVGDGSTVNDLRERIDLYNDGQYISFQIRYEGIGLVSIEDITFRFKRLKGFYNYY